LHLIIGLNGDLVLCKASKHHPKNKEIEIKT